MPEIDNCNPLTNSRHERFACLLAKGELSLTKAYAAAFGLSDRRQASKLSSKHDIAGRVQWIKQQAAMGDVMDIAEKRRIAAEIARNVDQEPRDRIAACRLDNDLAVDGAEATGMTALGALIGRLRK